MADASVFAGPPDDHHVAHRERDAFEGDARDDELARANAHAGKRAFVSPQGGVHQGDLMVAGGENPGGRQQRGHHLHVFQRPTRPLGELGCQVFVTPQQGGYDHPW